MFHGFSFFFFADVLKLRYEISLLFSTTHTFATTTKTFSHQWCCHWQASKNTFVLMIFKKKKNINEKKL